MCALERTTVELADPPLEVDVPAEIPPERNEKPNRRTGLWVVVGVLVVCAAVLVGLYTRHRPAANSASMVTIEPTQFTRVLRLKGTTEAVQSRTITAPILAGAQVGSLVITRLAPAGTKIKKGDLLVEFDRQAQIKNALDKQADFQKFASQVAENQAQESAARAKDETELRQAEGELKKDELEMRRNEILSRIDVEKNHANLEQAKANLAQLRQTFDLKRRSAQAAIRILELQRDKARADMLHAQANADQMQIRAPIGGVVVLHSTWKQETLADIQEGDQVRAGLPLVDVVDPSSMQISVEANQQDIAELHLGQLAQARLDAYPEIVFPAKLELLAPLGMSGNFSDKRHFFTALFSVQGNNPKLMPDLSAAVDVELDRRNDVLVVPRESVVQEGQNQYVWVKSHVGFHKQRVSVVSQNDTQAVIQSGLLAGDEVERNPGLKARGPRDE